MAFSLIWLSTITTCFVRDIWKLSGSETIYLFRDNREREGRKPTEVEEDGVGDSEFLAVVDVDAGPGCVDKCALSNTNILHVQSTDLHRVKVLK